MVLATEIIEHLPFNPYPILSETFRVLKPKGKLILSTPNLPKMDNLLPFLFGRTIHPETRLDTLVQPAVRGLFGSRVQGKNDSYSEFTLVIQD